MFPALKTIALPLYIHTSTDPVTLHVIVSTSPCRPWHTETVLFGGDNITNNKRNTNRSIAIVSKLHAHVYASCDVMRDPWNLSQPLPTIAKTRGFAEKRYVTNHNAPDA